MQCLAFMKYDFSREDENNNNTTRQKHRRFSRYRNASWYYGENRISTPNNGSVVLRQAQVVARTFAESNKVVTFKYLLDNGSTARRQS